MDEVKSDPLFYTHVKIFASTLFSLKLFKSLPGMYIFFSYLLRFLSSLDIYNFFGHPITKVELMGVVVGKVQKGAYTIVSGN